MSLKPIKYYLYFLPVIVACTYFFIKSANFLVHDFGNSYFPATIAKQQLPVQNYVYNVYNFNQYVWQKGHSKEVLDFYLNTPFTVAAAYPFVFFKNALIAKKVFNAVSILLFVCSLFVLSKFFKKQNLWLFAFVPIIFFTAIQNQIMFGQWYFIIFAATIFAMHWCSNKKIAASILFANAILLKVFPIMYLFAFWLNNKRKFVLYAIAACGLFFLASFSVINFSFWKEYLLQALPTAYSTGSTTDYFIGNQSIETLLRHLFVADDFYNPNVLYNSSIIYYLLLFLAKSIIVITIAAFVIKNKQNLIETIAATILAVLLLQSRNATYAQIMVLIPLIVYCNRSINIKYKIAFAFIVLAMVNYPYNKFLSSNTFLQFGRLWLTLLITILFLFTSIKLEVTKKMLAISLFFIPYIVKAFTENIKDESQYVLPNKQQFICYDFEVNEKKLVAKILNKNGADTLQTNIVVNSFNDTACTIINNEIYWKNEKLNLPKSKKIKAVIINNNSLFFLTDYHSRFGLFNLKMLKLTN